MNNFSVSVGESSFGFQGQAQSVRKPVVLIVDDHSINCLLVTAELDDLCDVVAAESGECALELALRLQPELILLDINMPGGMDGFEVCRCLKSNPETAGIPVIFLTAVEDTVSEEKGLALGAVDYIHKPFHPPVLRARVRNHLLLQQQRRELQALSYLDPLTRLLNQRGFTETLRREWQRSARQGRPLALLLIEINRFSAYSYTCGYVAGEVLLQELAAVFASEVFRGNDYVARYDAERFACLLGDTDLDGARVIAERIHSHVRNLAIPDLCAPGASLVSICTGMASDVPVAGGVEAATDLFVRAQRDLEICVNDFNSASGTGD
ncbi:MAG: diguanylate cyclase [Pusillimonas sp.]